MDLDHKKLHAAVTDLRAAQNALMQELGTATRPSTQHMDARSMASLLKEIDHYEKLRREAGTDKWFVPGTPFGIENCKKHKAFFDAGADYYERFFMASNRTGKSIAGSFEMACHLTGEYPDWWKGRRFDNPIEAWAVGPDAKATRDTIQKELVGGLGDMGTGMIPADAIISATSLSGVAGGVDTLLVRHKSGGISKLNFKNYEQDIKAFYGTAKHVIWLDEECPDLIYNECLLRTMTTNGIMLLTFTPLHGLTPLVVRFCRDATFLAGAKPIVSLESETPTEEDERFEGLVKTAKAVVQAGWDDAPWLTMESRTRMLNDTPPHLRDARSKGIPAMGSGNVYPVPAEEVLVDAFVIPNHWQRMYALDVGWNKTACLWAAIDPETDTVYIYDEHYQGEAVPSTHAAAIRGRGEWMWGVIDPASRGRSQVDGTSLMHSYKNLGLKIFPANNEVEGGIANTMQRLSTGRIKVFRHLQNWQKEYMLYRRDERGRIIKEHDHLMDCMRYIINNLSRARSKTESVGTGGYNGTIRYGI